MWCNAQGFGPSHKEVMRVGGIPKLVALLGSSSETVKERAIEALLVSWYLLGILRWKSGLQKSSIIS